MKRCGGSIALHIFAHNDLEFNYGGSVFGKEVAEGAQIIHYVGNIGI